MSADVCHVDFTSSISRMERFLVLGYFSDGVMLELPAAEQHLNAAQLTESRNQNTYGGTKRVMMMIMCEKVSRCE